uniref:Uncharacterized protein n=1 Tax=Arundo donax TaxID=35708 RepID=A0A0A9HAI9_ARUDO
MQKCQTYFWQITTVWNLTVVQSRPDTTQSMSTSYNKITLFSDFPFYIQHRKLCRLLSPTKIAKPPPYCISMELSV